MKIDTLRKQLGNLNSDIAALMGLQPVPLSHQIGDAQKDPLFLYGIVGGKDVGKTVLINQLAGTTISLDTDIIDEGTRQAVAFCHHQDAEVLRKRFTTENIDRIKFAHHQRDRLKSVVFIDLPDFDSRFMSHREDTRRLLKHLEGMIWVTTPRKYGDHELLHQLEAIAQSHENYFIVLNKIDQLEDKAALDTVRQEIISYLSRQCHKRGIPLPKPEHFFIISALRPGQYEFAKLHERLIRRHSPNEISQAKSMNLRAEFTKNIQRMHADYGLRDRVKEIDSALEKIREKVALLFSENYYETVWRRIASMETLRRRISGALFAQQVEGWPILRLLFYPLAGIISGLGGRLAFSQTGEQWSDSARDLLRYQGQPASLNMQKIRIAVEESFPALKQELGDTPDFSKLLEDKFDHFFKEYEDRVTDYLVKGVTVPGRLKKMSIYLPLIWFPFLQPIFLHLADIKDAWLAGAGMQDFYTLLISLFGASSLLVSLVFLILFYTVWLVLIYARGARKAQQKGEEEFRNLWYTRFLTWVTEVLAQPLPNVRAVLSNKIMQLEQIASTVEALNRSN